ADEREQRRLVVALAQSCKELILGKLLNRHVSSNGFELTFDLERDSFVERVRRNETREMETAVRLRHVGHRPFERVGCRLWIVGQRRSVTGQRPVLGPDWPGRGYAVPIQRASDKRLSIDGGVQTSPHVARAQ